MKLSELRVLAEKDANAGYGHFLSVNMMRELLSDIDQEIRAVRVGAYADGFGLGEKSGMHEPVRADRDERREASNMYIARGLERAECEPNVAVRVGADPAVERSVAKYQALSKHLAEQRERIECLERQDKNTLELLEEQAARIASLQATCGKLLAIVHPGGQFKQTVTVPELTARVEELEGDSRTMRINIADIAIAVVRHERQK